LAHRHVVPAGIVQLTETVAQLARRHLGEVEMRLLVPEERRVTRAWLHPGLSRIEGRPHADDASVAVARPARLATDPAVRVIRRSERRPHQKVSPSQPSFLGPLDDGTL